jgi:hypothetical protein
MHMTFSCSAYKLKRFTKNFEKSHIFLILLYRCIKFEVQIGLALMFIETLIGKYGIYITHITRSSDKNNSPSTPTIFTINFILL